MELSKAYNFQKAEDKIYALWEKSGFFQPKADRPNGDNTDTFSIAMPPPNATGELHIGHAMFLTIQDLLTRWRRMKGDIALWLPGTDHASIATQNKVEKILLEKEGKTRHDLGRDNFLRRVNQYIKESQEVIRRQIRKMGSSCDWSRERYTLDAGLTMAVQEVFIRMYNDGLIYRGNRIVNWCPRCESTLADDEVEYKTVKGKFYYLKYGPVVIGTARPETKFLDKTIVVHPKDKRYKHLIDKKFIISWINGEVEARVITDEASDMKIGTGTMTLTPAHSFIDFELAQKYHLPIVQIINEKGNLTEVAGEFAGQNAHKARTAIIAKMQSLGLVEKIDNNYEHNLSLCYRCETPIEPLVSKQWFINVNKKFKVKSKKLKVIVGKNEASLKEMALAVVKSGEIKIIPKRFEKIYYHWMNNLRDWCVSRQIWFGHRIPVWYCQDKVKSEKLKVKSSGQKLKVQVKLCNNIIVSTDKPTKCSKCGSDKLKQDPDTLDTWFSSGLWTFSTLGWPFEEMQVLAARHGMTDAHARGGFIGQEKKNDLPLNKEGIAQAEKLAQELKDTSIDVIFCSDMKRAVHTAKIVNKYHKVNIVQDKRLREYQFGFMHGKTREELKKQYPDMPEWKHWPIDFQYKNEERPCEMQERVESFIHDVGMQYYGKNIFVVTHSGVLDFFAMHTHNLNFEAMKDVGHKKCKIEKHVFKNRELALFHPTTVMETGYDILFFWVARMILMTTYALGEVPFKTVYLHGLVRDKLGRKMSKSLGNGIDPLDVIKKYGADAVRLSLIIGTTPGNDVRLYEEKIAGYRNFVTKVWNIARFIIINSKLKTQNSKLQLKAQNFLLSDKWILYELNELVKRVNKNLEKYQFSRAGEDIYDFMWHKLADWYIEAVKIENQPHQRQILTYVLEKCLILLHPFVPFVTEKIWSKVTDSLLIAEPWVEKIDFKIPKAEAQKFIKIQKKISKKRNATKKSKQMSKKEIADLKKYIKFLKARLKDKAFLTKAPADVIQKEKTRLREALAKLA